MKWIVALCLVAGCFAFEKDAMLEQNRIPDSPALSTFGTTCDECQSLVKRFVEASHDKQKMVELKVLLNALCHETSYPAECSVFVNNIDTIIHRLEPYLKDEHRVCKSLHMCSNNRLDAFRRIGLLYAKRTLDKVEGMKDLVCDECQFAAKELKTLVEDKEKQAAIKEFFAKQVCIHAGSYRGMCDMLVEQFLPEMFQELDVILQDTKKACADVGFCAASGKSSKLTFLPFEKSTLHPLLQFWQGAKTIKTSRGAVLMSCLECKISVDGLLLEAEDQRNDIAKEVQNLVCLHVLPANFTPSCEDFMSMYLPTVLYMTFEQFSGEGVCKKMNTCDQVSLTRLSTVPKRELKQLSCLACNGVQAFVKDAFVVSEVQHNAVAAAQMQCDNDYLPAIMQPLCHSVLARVIPRLLTKTAAISAAGDFCHQAC